MNPLDLLIIALAASRITRLIVHDSITEPLRYFIWRRFPGSQTTWGDSDVTQSTKDSFGRQVGMVGKVDVFKLDGLWFADRSRFIGSLLECHWCTGLWVGIGAFAVLWFYPVVVPYAAALAVAEVIGLLNDR